MSDVNIKSKNQSGGITAQNVNAASGTQFNTTPATEQEPRIKSFFWWVFGIVGLLAACLSIYKFLLS